MIADTQNVLDKLLRAQELLIEMPKDKHETFLELVMSEYGSEFNGLFFDRMIKIHSVASFMVKESTKRTEQLGEHYFIANGAAVSAMLPASSDRQSQLLVDIVASGIATPPTSADFKPLFQRVILPIQAIVTIGDAQ